MQLAFHRCLWTRTVCSRHYSKPFSEPQHHRDPWEGFPRVPQAQCFQGVNCPKILATIPCAKPGLSAQDPPVISRVWSLLSRSIA